MGAIILDTGIITQYFSKTPNLQIKTLFNSILNQIYDAHILLETICEVEYHLAKMYNQDSAKSLIFSLIHQYPLNIEALNLDLAIKSGHLKSQYSSQLSYIDCMLLACALNKKYAVHSTEDFAEKIPTQIKNKLNFVKYSF